ncbi:MAG: multidrug effflux MFS transporter [Dehalococcoidia bacterium]|nr:multidrug effflux MFS transporter [Dehalococcoidia bacterium]MCB9485480.1 multidrug effflux MFS transporter [Thermoflexaceae bacterium]
MTTRATEVVPSLPLKSAVLLTALNAVPPLAIDMFLPSMPAMSEEFDVRPGVLQLAVTLFLLALAMSQLIYGPMSDRFGRRPVLIAGLGLFIAGGLICMVAPSAEVLIAARVLQGIGGGAGPALGRAIVLDVYGRQRSAQFLAQMTIAIALAPMIAPVIGSGLQALGWRTVFVALTAIGIAMLLGYLWLFKETIPAKDATAMNGRQMTRNYGTLLSSRTFTSYGLVMALMFSAQLVFISSSSFVLIDELGLSPGLFGLSFGSVAFGIMAGATLSRRLVQQMAESRVTWIGTVVSAVATAVMAVVTLAGAESVFVIVLPMFVSAAGMGILRPPATAASLIPFPQMAGLASAVQGFSQIAFASVWSIVYGGAVGVGVVSMVLAIALAANLGLLTLAVLRPGREAT